MIHATPLDKSQFGGIFYAHSRIPCVHISCDYCDFFNHDVDICPLLGRPHRLEASASLNRELYLCSLLKIELSLGSPTLEVRSCDDFDVRNEAPIPSGNDFWDVSSDPS